MGSTPIATRYVDDYSEAAGNYWMPAKQTMEEYPLKAKLSSALLLCAVTPSAFAVDYSLRSECARQNQSYSERRIVKQAGALYSSRLGANTATFKMSGDEFNYYAITQATGSTIIDLLNKAHGTLYPVNLCVRASDGYIYGVELTK